MDKTIIYYSSNSIKEIFKKLNSSDKGITCREAGNRRQKYGRNEILMEKRRGPLGIFIDQFKSPLVLILLAASVLSGFLGEIVSTVIIVAIILMSAILAFFQEYKSEKIVSELQKRVALKALVVREGKEKEIIASDLTIGDIVLIGLGKVVPADLRLVEVDNLLINESMLTGESFPVEKTNLSIKAENDLPSTMKNIAFSGTYVAQGSGRGIVVAIGKNTELGKTAHLLQTKVGKTEFQIGISKFGIFLFKIIITFSALIFIFLAAFRHDVIGSLLFSLAIAVGISPELLPIIITINLSRGAKMMSNKKVIIKRLMSIEDLGNADILCTDKTGTLTEGKISLINYFDFNNVNNPLVFEYSLLCDSGLLNKNRFENPLDAAIQEHSSSKQLSGLLKKYKLIDDISFDYVRRRMSMIVEHQGKRIIITKGAAEEIMAAADYYYDNGKVISIKKHNAKIKKIIQEEEDKGVKIILIAYREINKKSEYEVAEEKNLILLGYLLFSDKPKLSAKNSLEALKNLGVSIKILTGDSEATVRYLAEKVALPITGVILGANIDQVSADKLCRIVEKNNIFAKITPEHKLRIVNALRTNGHTVSFLGDGVNDAPALRAADVGISVDTATDVAKEAADVILLEKRLSVLADGIKEGRKVFGNTLKYIFCTISSNFGNMFSVAGAALLLPFIPMLPVQILLLNFLSDFPMLAISADTVDEEYLKKPKHWDIGVINKFMVFFGLASAIFDFITFGFLYLVLNSSPALFQAGWFWESYLTEVLLIFVIRTRKHFWQSRPGKILVASWLLTTVLVLIILYTPLRLYFSFEWLSLRTASAIVAIALGYFGLVEIGKKMFYKKFDI